MNRAGGGTALGRGEPDARAHCADILSRPPGTHRGEWEPAIAEYEPGALAPRAAVVPPRPPKSVS
jgi:hypothetical protein